MKLTIFIISGLLLLTGCGNSSSSQQELLSSQIKLIEYEKCLELQQVIYQGFSSAAFSKISTIDNRSVSSGLFEKLFDLGKPNPKTGLIEGLQVQLENCKAYRP